MILHICVPEKFTRPFIEFTAEHFGTQSHSFLFRSTEEELRKFDPATYAIITADGFPFEVFYYQDATPHIVRTLKLIIGLYRCEKIIIHGLFLFGRLAQILAYFPLLLRKSYWAMWGGDFYFPEEFDPLKRRIIRKMGHLVTLLPGDAQYVKQHYGATGQHIDCLVYPTNVFTPIPTPPRKDSTIRLQVGNSAFPTNRHREVFEALAQYKDRDIEIICPLSYGEKEYREDVIALGEEMFAEKFSPLEEFLPYGEYQRFLASIDIAVFNHNRQQGMGNLITHLGLGHKVYLRSDQSPWELFTDMGLELHDIAEGISIEYTPSLKNKRLIASHFTHERLVEQWEMIYGRPS
jgi:dTDP-N-acetylfucosamine:lipid II N-acetylfucosaminyltransferase